MKKIIAAILAACTLSLSAQFAFAEYINVSGKTIGEIAEQEGYANFSEFLAEYGLPADLPADTTEAEAYYNIPTGKIAEQLGIGLDELKESLGLGDDVTADTPWGEAEGKSPLRYYIGEEYLDDFKAEYGLGDEVTGDTLYGEVRNIVDQKTLEDQQKYADIDYENITVGEFCELNDLLLEDFKATFGFGDEVTADTPWKDVEASVFAQIGVDDVENPAVTILLNGEELVLDVDAYIKNDRTMVPLRGVFEACGANVNWDAETRTVLITKTEGEETTFIFLQADSDTAFINSEQKTLDAPAEIVNDRTMVPLRFIMEELGALVSWDGETRTVSIVAE